MHTDKKEGSSETLLFDSTNEFIPKAHTISLRVISELISRHCDTHALQQYTNIERDAHSPRSGIFSLLFWHFNYTCFNIFRLFKWIFEWGTKHTHFSSHFSSFFWQVERKRHIGNDIVNIIFIDGDSCDFSPNCIKSQFTRILFINWFFLRLQLHVFSYFLFIEKKKKDAFYVTTTAKKLMTWLWLTTLQSAIPIHRYSLSSVLLWVKFAIDWNSHASFNGQLTPDEFPEFNLPTCWNFRFN